PRLDPVRAQPRHPAGVPDPSSRHAAVGPALRARRRPPVLLSGGRREPRSSRRRPSRPAGPPAQGAGRPEAPAHVEGHRHLHRHVAGAGRSPRVAQVHGPPPPGHPPSRRAGPGDVRPGAALQPAHRRDPGGLEPPRRIPGRHSMRYKLIGRSGLRVSQLALGTMTFGEDWGWGASKEESRRMFDAFAEAGGNFVDTGNNYTNGASERFVGEFTASDRDHFVVATKFSLTERPG